MTNNLKYISFIEAKAIDDHLIKNLDIPIKELIDTAGMGIANWLDTHLKTPHVNAVIGKGNNGKDVLSALNQSKTIVSATLLFPLKNNRSCEFLQELQINKKISIITNSKQLIETSPIIDGLLGTGSRKELSTDVINLIEKINQINTTVISIDIPSGLTEENTTQCINATHTLAIMYPKNAHKYKPKTCGKITVIKLKHNNEWLKQKQNYIKDNFMEII